jgi:hypothetical protein
MRCCQVDPFGDHFGRDCIWRQTVLKTTPNECCNIIQLEQFLTVWAEDQISSTDDPKRQGITIARSGLVQMKALFGVRDQPEVELVNGQRYPSEGARRGQSGTRSIGFGRTEPVATKLLRLMAISIACGLGCR